MSLCLINIRTREGGRLQTTLHAACRSLSRESDQPMSVSEEHLQEPTAGQKVCKWLLELPSRTTQLRT